MHSPAPYLLNIMVILTSIEPILEKMCSSASTILVSIDKVLVSFQPNCSISKLMVLDRYLEYDF